MYQTTINMKDKKDLETLKELTLEEQRDEICMSRLALKPVMDQDKVLKTEFDAIMSTIFHEEGNEDKTMLAYTGYKVTRSSKTTIDLKDKSFGVRKSKEIDALFKDAVDTQSKIDKMEEELKRLKDFQTSTMDVLIPKLRDANKNGHNFKLDVKETYSLRRA